MIYSTAFLSFDARVKHIIAWFSVVFNTLGKVLNEASACADMKRRTAP
jgi:hypothetical protein